MSRIGLVSHEMIIKNITEEDEDGIVLKSVKGGSIEAKVRVKGRE